MALQTRLIQSEALHVGVHTSHIDGSRNHASSDFVGSRPKIDPIADQPRAVTDARMEGRDRSQTQGLNQVEVKRQTVRLAERLGVDPRGGFHVDDFGEVSRIIAEVRRKEIKSRLCRDVRQERSKLPRHGARGKGISRGKEGHKTKPKDRRADRLTSETVSATVLGHKSTVVSP